MRILVFILILTCQFANGQKSLYDIDLSKIPQKKIRNFIEYEITKDIQKVSDFKACYIDQNDYKEFNSIEQQFVIDKNFQEVWEVYKYTQPNISWNGRMFSFGLLVSKWNDEILYYTDPNFQYIDTGQVYFLNLKLMSGIYNMAVGFQITEVDSVKRIMKFSYLEDGKSHGQQTIRFIPVNENTTKIVHSSVFRCNSYLREHVLYPFFHRRIIDEFHFNMQQCLIAGQ